MFWTIVLAILFVEVVLPFIGYLIFGEDSPGCLFWIIIGILILIFAGL